MSCVHHRKAIDATATIASKQQIPVANPVVFNSVIPSDYTLFDDVDPKTRIIGISENELGRDRVSSW